jgi:formylglycine-generating enzyme required for sulfatase activity
MNTSSLRVMNTKPLNTKLFDIKLLTLLPKEQVTSLKFNKPSRARYGTDHKRKYFSYPCYSNYKRNSEFTMIACPRGVCYKKERPSFWNPTPDTQTPKKQIIEPFLLSETTVTEKLYEEVMNNLPLGFSGKGDHPVKGVYMDDAAYFCNRLSLMHGFMPYYEVGEILDEDEWGEEIVCIGIKANKKANGYRLPSENEWEYAARAGTRNEWAGCNYKNVLEDYAWFDENSGDEVHPVKSLKPNEWGFYDMSGNVWEWCFSTGQSEYEEFQIKGGGCSSSDSELKIENHEEIEEKYSETLAKIDITGFRIARTIIV